MSQTKNQTVFIGRELLIARLKARLEHYDVFLYTGIPGIGKTSLSFKLLEAAKETDKELAPYYFRLWPGEGATSFINRIEHTISGRTVATGGDMVDPYTRLLNLLQEKKSVIAIDGIHQIGQDNLSRLIKTCCRKLSNGSRLLLISKIDASLSALERNELVTERIGALEASAVKAIVAQNGFGDMADDLARAASHGMAAGHPLTLITALKLYNSESLPVDELRTRSARSPAAFKEIVQDGFNGLSDEDRVAYHTMAIGSLPIIRSAANKLFGSDVIDNLQSKNLLFEFEDKLVGLHNFAATVLGEIEQADLKKLEALAKEHLKRSKKSNDPYPALKAAEIMRQLNKSDQAIDILSNMIPMLGMPELVDSFLRELTVLKKELPDDNRIAVLILRARLLQVDAKTVYNELINLSKSKDKWVKQNAMITMTLAASRMKDVDKVAKNFSNITSLISKNEQSTEFYEAAIAAAETLFQAGKYQQAVNALKSFPSSKTKSAKTADIPIQITGQQYLLLARINYQQHKIEQAIKEAEEAVKLFQSANLSKEVFHALTLLGELYRNKGVLSKAATVYDNLTQTAKQWGVRKYIHESMFNKIRFAIDLGNFEMAKEEIDNFSETQGSLLSPPERRQLIQLELELAMRRGDLAATNELMKSSQIAYNRNDKSFSDIYYHLTEGFIALYRGNLDQCETVIEWWESEVLPDCDTYLAAVGYDLKSQLAKWKGEIGSYVTLLEEATNLYEQCQRSTDYFMSLLNTARLYASLNETTKATSYYDKADKIAQQSGVKYLRHRADTTKAELLIYQNEYKEAKKLISKSVEQSIKLGDVWGQIDSQLQQVWLALLTADTATALKTATKARDQAVNSGYLILVALIESLEGIARYSRRGAGAAKKVLGHSELIQFPFETALYSGRLQVILQGNEATEEDFVNFASHIRKASIHVPEAHLTRFTTIGEVLDLPPRDTYLVWDKNNTEVCGFSRWTTINRKDYDLYLDVDTQTVLVKGQELDLADVNQKEAIGWLVELLKSGTKGCKSADVEEIFDDPKRMNQKLTQLKNKLHQAAGIKGSASGFIEKRPNNVFRITPRQSFLVTKRIEQLPSRLLSVSEVVLKTLNKNKSASLAQIIRSSKEEEQVINKVLRVFLNQGIAEEQEGKTPKFKVQQPPQI